MLGGVEFVTCEVKVRVGFIERVVVGCSDEVVPVSYVVGRYW